MKFNMNRLAKHQLQIIAIGVIILVVGTGSYLYINRSKNQPDDRKVIYESEAQLPKEEELVRIPKDAKSQVCEQLPATTVEKIAGIKTTGARVSLPTTKNAGGTVSACTYITAEKESSIRNIVVTSRVFDKAEDAKKAYEIVANGRKDDSFFNEAKTQMTAIKSNRLSTVTIIYLAKDKPVKEEVFTSLADQLK